jgi:lysophospholipase L1-like esterase
LLDAHPAGKLGRNAAVIRGTMPMRLLGVLGFCVLAAGALAAPACPSVTMPRVADLAGMQDDRPLTIVAFGSSSTQGAGATGPGATYPAQLAHVLQAAMPDRDISVINRGVGGQDSAEMLARLEADVLALRPRLVIWQVGANGVLRDLDPVRFQAEVSQGIATIRAAGAAVVLMDNQRAPRIDAKPGAALFAHALRTVAAETGTPLFGRTALMDAWAAAGFPNADFLIADGLHHNDRGYACLARALAQALLPGLQPDVAVAVRR